MNRRILLVIPLIMITLSACRDRIEPEVDDFVEYGWTLYGERDFRGAQELFLEGLSMDSLYFDGYNGMGWSYIELTQVAGAADSAIAAFDEGLISIDTDSSKVRFEMLAGIALCYHVVGNYEDAIENGVELYEWDPLFEFSHNWRINFEDIIILVAASYFAEGEFSQSLIWVQKMDAEFNVDVTTNQGRAELALKIEDLQS